ncbi:MAG: hypothetical protein GX601_05460, partial [Anaerolineales bacterium]|nr:hypothetical protein [Anaerolineales bacterium]
GRWHVVNGMVVQPDMNQPQGESFVRHFLLGKAVMRSLLGVEPDVAYCVDSFGHAGTLPQILQGCGCRAYVFMRPGPHEKDLPSQAFWWQGPDGSRVLAFRITGSYGTGERTDLAEHIGKAVQAKPPELDDTMAFFGVGNHGGGPTRRQIEAIRTLAAGSESLDIRFSTPQAYFDAIAQQAGSLPVVADELQMHAVGCYSAVSELKRVHRQAECALLVAERIVSLARLWADRPAPKAALDGAWFSLCFHQFHDILGGCSIKDGLDDAIAALKRVTLTAQELTIDAGRAIAQRVDTRGPGGAVVLFNPFPYRSQQFVEYEPWTGWQPWQAGGWGLADDQGQPVAVQLVETRDAATSSGHGLTRIVFRADLPPLGYRLYRFAPGVPQADTPVAVRATPTSLENEYLTVRLDPASGAIVSCVERASGLELVGEGGWNVAQVLEDTSDTWSHGIRRFEEAGAGIIGEFGAAKITVAEAEGPMQASLLVERTYESSTWLQQIILRAGERELLVRNWLCWQGRWRVVKLAFDAPTDAPASAHDVPFGWLARPCDGAEVPTQMWVDVSGPARSDPAQTVGLAVLDDGKYGCDVNGGRLRLTILRCPPYAYHIPHAPGSKLRYDWIDQGPQEFTLVLRPHVGDWREAGIVRRARELNLGVTPITMHAHTGERPTVDSLAELTSAELELTALKPAEDGDGYVLRVADRHGRGGAGELRWLGQCVPVSVEPFQVVTLRLRLRDGRWRAERCTMLETPLE